MPYGDGVRAHYTQDAAGNRELARSGGIVSATVEDLAAAMGVQAETIEEAIKREELEPLTDTARQKRTERGGRATAPSSGPWRSRERRDARVRDRGRWGRLIDSSDRIEGAAIPGCAGSPLRHFLKQGK